MAHSRYSWIVPSLAGLQTIAAWRGFGWYTVYGVLCSRQNVLASVTAGWIQRFLESASCQIACHACHPLAACLLVDFKLARMKAGDKMTSHPVIIFWTIYSDMRFHLQSSILVELGLKIAFLQLYFCMNFIQRHALLHSKLLYRRITYSSGWSVM